MDASATGHRPIELQSPEDFAYLVNNVRRAATDSINAAFPQVGGADEQDDELRVEIETMVHDYITQTFTLASPNMTINGMPFDPSPYLDRSVGAPAPPTPEEQYEPFDGRKRARVEDLARDEEDLLREIAALKRRVPGATAAAWAAAARTGVADDERALEAAKERVVATAAGTRRGNKRMMLADDDQDDVTRPLERQKAVETAFSGAVEALERLKHEMPATVAKMERAKQAGEYAATAG